MLAWPESPVISIKWNLRLNCSKLNSILFLNCFDSFHFLNAIFYYRNKRVMTSWSIKLFSLWNIFPVTFLFFTNNSFLLFREKILLSSFVWFPACSDMSRGCSFLSRWFTCLHWCRDFRFSMGSQWQNYYSDACRSAYFSVRMHTSLNVFLGRTMNWESEQELKREATPLQNTCSPKKIVILILFFIFPCYKSLLKK